MNNKNKIKGGKMKGFYDFIGLLKEWDSFKDWADVALNGDYHAFFTIDVEDQKVDKDGIEVKIKIGFVFPATTMIDNKPYRWPLPRPYAECFHNIVRTLLLRALNTKNTIKEYETTVKTIAEEFGETLQNTIEEQLRKIKEKK